MDFDFFSAEPLDRDALRIAFPLFEHALVLQDRSNTLTWLSADDTGATVKVSWFGTIGFGRFGRPDLTVDGVLQVALPNDLLATELKVLLQRVEAKDYADIAALLRAGVSLERGLGIACAMFGPQFQPSECLKAMTWFEGGDLETLADADRERLVEAAASVRRLPSVRRQATRLVTGCA